VPGDNEPAVSPGHRTQAQRREETRERVLAAAARPFAQRGFDATSLDAIAEEAGFTRGAVYIDALGLGLWAQHMLHGSRAVPQDLYSEALALVVDGIAARTTVPGGIP
jgi:Bacterial regulatory proteins, tetR family